MSGLRLTVKLDSHSCWESDQQVVVAYLEPLAGRVFSASDIRIQGQALMVFLSPRLEALAPCDQLRPPEDNFVSFERSIHSGEEPIPVEIDAQTLYPPYQDSSVPLGLETARSFVD